jgi:hypothetical protein
LGDIWSLDIDNASQHSHRPCGIPSFFVQSTPKPTPCYLHGTMHLFAQWTTRSLSQPLTQDSRLSLRVSSHLIRCFSSHHPLLAYRDLSPEEKEVRRKYSREYAAKRRRESEASLIEAKNEYDRTYSVREYQNEEIKGRRRFRNWVYQSHVPLWSRRGS